MRPCPFCGSTKIKYSIKTSTSQFKPIWRACFYCWECNCYGPRVVYKPGPDDTKNRILIERNEELREQAYLAWESRK